MSHIPYYYQIECNEAVQNALKRSVDKQLIVSATGTGKTKMCVDIIRPFKQKLWLTHNIELIEQSSIALLSEYLDLSKEHLEKEFSERDGLLNIIRKDLQDPFSKTITDSIGIIKEELLIIDKPICVASIQTIWRRLEQIPPDTFDVVVVDEAHHASAPTWSKTLNHFTPKLRLGLTATPHRLIDEATLDDLFDEIVYEYPIGKAIKDGYLCKPSAIKVKTSADLNKVGLSGGDFNNKELSEKVNTPQRNYLICDKYLEYAKGRPFIAFCCNVEHTIDLCQAFNDKEVKANYVVGDKLLTPDRDAIINAFKSQNYTTEEAEGLVNCMIATEGFDARNIGCVILACPTKSKTKFYQMLGRGLRLKDDYFVSLFGQNCIILDVVDNTTKHLVITCESEDALLPIDDKLFITDENRAKIKDAIAKREAMMTIVDRKEDEVVELFPLPRIKARFGDNAHTPINSLQESWLKRNGFDTINNSYTLHQFNTLLFNSAADEKDILTLKEKGFDITQGVSFGQVQRLKMEGKI